MSKKQKKHPNFELNTKYNRTFSAVFKQKKVAEILSKQVSVTQVCQIYGVSRTSVYKWLQQYGNLEKGTKQVIQMESEALKTQKLLEQVAELERIVGQKQLEIDYLDKTLEQASLEVGYDLKKKYGPKSSNISESITRNQSIK